MSFPVPNAWFFLLVAIVLAMFLLDLAANLLNLKNLREDPPENLADVYDGEDYRRSQRYTRATTRFDLLRSSVQLTVFLAFWFAGGFPWLDAWVRSLGWGPVPSGLAGLSLLFLAGQLLSLPFDLHDTFVLEARFGFNKTTPATFAADFFKGLLLAALVGLPVTAAVLWFFETGGALAWLQAWAAVAALSLLLSYLAPRLILPLFYKFTPLANGELKQAIEAMAERCRFPLREIFVIDGSRRSTKGNAFFTGFGRHKKIALYDTLVSEHDTQELVSILAHEVGHFKKRHVPQQMAFAIAQLGILFFLLHLFLRNPDLSAAFGVREPAVYLSFVFFAVLYKPVSQLLALAGAALSRKNEFEADAFAAQITAAPESLARALKKLSRSNLSNLTPHPFFVFLHYSHPPLARRLAALQTLEPAPP